MILKGLLPTPREKMRYSFGATFGYSTEPLPDEFNLREPLEIKNQNIPKDSFICVAEAGIACSEQQENVVLEPAFRVKNITELLGSPNWINEGTDLAVGAKASLKGDLERQESPLSVEKHGVEYCANPVNWPRTYDQIAAKHAKKSWFWIGISSGDFFDRIRGAIYRFRDEKRAVQIGVTWQDNWLGTYIDKETTPTGGHSIAVIGWKKDYLKIQNSVGKAVGENGIQYIHRNIINKNKQFGALMFVPMPPYQSHESILLKSEIYRAGFWGKVWITLRNFTLFK